MPRYSKTGVYTWHRRGLGVLPGGGATIGMSPTGPITAPAIAPSASPPIASILSQLTSALSSASADAVDAGVLRDTAPYFTSAALSDPGGSSSRIATVGRVIAALRPDARNIQDQLAATLGSLTDWERFLVSRRFPYKGFTASYPDPCPTTAGCKTSVGILLSDLSQHIVGQMEANLQPRISVSVAPSIPSASSGWGPSRSNLDSLVGPGMTASTSPAAAVVSQGGSGAVAAATQTQTVLDQNGGSGITQVVQGSGPTDAIPGYGVEPTQVPTGPGAGAALPSGLPSWWKPALAVAIGAVVGVGVGRAIAG